MELYFHSCRWVRGLTILLTGFVIEGVDDAAFEANTLKERSTRLFSGSLATIFFCLDSITILHLGIKESQERCVCKAAQKKNCKGIFLLVLRIGLIVFARQYASGHAEPAAPWSNVTHARAGQLEELCVTASLGFSFRESQENTF
jgi:hypothetical protein